VASPTLSPSTRVDDQRCDGKASAGGTDYRPSARRPDDADHRRANRSTEEEQATKRPLMRPLTQRFKTFNNKRNKSAIEVVVNSFLMDRKVVRMLP